MIPLNALGTGFLQHMKRTDDLIGRWSLGVSRLMPDTGMHLYEEFSDWLSFLEIAVRTRGTTSDSIYVQFNDCGDKLTVHLLDANRKHVVDIDKDVDDISIAEMRTLFLEVEAHVLRMLITSLH